jgi:hypothetical protein
MRLAMEITDKGNSLFHALGSVEPATVVGTWRRSGHTVARARGITVYRPSSIANRPGQRTTIFMHAGAPPAHGLLLRNQIMVRAFSVAEIRAK